MAKEVNMENMNNQQNGLQTIQFINRSDEGLFQIISIEQVPVADCQTQTALSYLSPGGLPSGQVNANDSIVNLANSIIYLNQNQPAAMKVDAVTENAEKRKKCEIETTINQPLHVSLNVHDVIYVNPKQYFRILKRRAQRQKLISDGKIPSSNGRKKYLHESRHQHAVKRIRGSGGRFSSKPMSTTKVEIENYTKP